MSAARKTNADPAVELLYLAVTNWVEKTGGKLVVIGGISVQRWPADNKGVFYVAVKCLGRVPMPILKIALAPDPVKKSKRKHVLVRNRKARS